LKTPANQIILVGDSAGGNLSIALLRYIQEFGADLKIPTPRCAILLSPWVAPLEYNTKLSPRFKTDYLSPIFLRWGALTYSETLPSPESHPYFTPLGQPFPTPVPMFVNAGTIEIFYPVCKRWVQEMESIEGNVVQMHEEIDACHDTLERAKCCGCS
jgi:acetyl esterase/lipase